MPNPTALQIIEAVFPTLVESARYARLIQNRIHALDDKEEATNIFGAALSDADLGIQGHVELSLLAHFPDLPFFGEEWKSSRNTKYFSGTAFVDAQELLVTLDPIDGTRAYLDNHRLYQVILTVISRASFEGAIVLFPTYNEYVYAIRGKGAFRGTFETPPVNASLLRRGTTPNTVYISAEYQKSKPMLRDTFDTVVCSAEYKKGNEEPYFSAILRGDLRGALLDSSQIIDGAALAFVAQEMGFIVRTHDGGPIPAPVDHPSLVLPGMVAGDSEETVAALLAALGTRA